MKKVKKGEERRMGVEGWFALFMQMIKDEEKEKGKGGEGREEEGEGREGKRREGEGSWE